MMISRLAARQISSVGLLITIAATRVAAQTSDRPFGDLGRYLTPDDTIYVVGRTSGEAHGNSASVSGQQLMITTSAGWLPMSSAEIAWVEKRGDAVWNGALIGAGTLGILVAAAAGSSCSPDCESAIPVAGAFGAGIGAGLGALIDWLHPGRTLVYGTRPSSVHALRAEPPVERVGLLWSRVRPGDRVSVQRRSGESLKGTFVRATDSTLLIESDGQPVQVDGTDIVAVTRRGSQLGRGIVLGPAVTATLTVTGALSDGSSAGEIAFAAAIGATGGLFWGALIGRIVPRRIPAYVAPPRTVRLAPIFTPDQRGALLSIRY